MLTTILLRISQKQRPCQIICNYPKTGARRPQKAWNPLTRNQSQGYIVYGQRFVHKLHGIHGISLGYLLATHGRGSLWQPTDRHIILPYQGCSGEPSRELEMDRSTFLPTHLLEYVAFQACSVFPDTTTRDCCASTRQIRRASQNFVNISSFIRLHQHLGSPRLVSAIPGVTWSHLLSSSVWGHE